MTVKTESEPFLCLHSPAISFGFGFGPRQPSFSVIDIPGDSQTLIPPVRSSLGRMGIEETVDGEDSATVKYRGNNVSFIKIVPWLTSPA